MQLKYFIKDTLVQVCKAIEEANEELVGTDALVNPRNAPPIGDKNNTIYAYLRDDEGDENYYRAVHLIDFDVSVHVSEGESDGAGGGINVGFLTLGAKGEHEKKAGSESRIRFSVPVVLPYPKGRGKTGDESSKVSLA